MELKCFSCSEPVLVFFDLLNLSTFRIAKLLFSRVNFQYSVWVLDRSFSDLKVKVLETYHQKTVNKFWQYINYWHNILVITLDARVVCFCRAWRKRACLGLNKNSAPCLSFLWFSKKTDLSHKKCSIWSQRFWNHPHIVISKIEHSQYQLQI